MLSNQLLLDHIKEHEAYVSFMNAMTQQVSAVVKNLDPKVMDLNKTLEEISKLVKAIELNQKLVIQYNNDLAVKVKVAGILNQ